MRTLVWIVSCNIANPNDRSGNIKPVHEQVNDATAQVEKMGGTIVDIQYMRTGSGSSVIGGAFPPIGWSEFLVRYTLPEELSKTDIITGQQGQP